MSEGQRSRTRTVGSGKRGSRESIVSETTVGTTSAQGPRRALGRSGMRSGLRSWVVGAVAVVCLIPYVGVIPALGILALAAMGRLNGRRWLIIGLAISVVGWMTRPAPPDLERGRALLERVAQRDLSGLDSRIESYRARVGRYPRDLAELGGRQPIDPVANFGRRGQPIPYVYEVDSTGSEYRLFSAGPDGIPDTADDLHLNHEGPRSEPEEGRDDRGHD